ncbi:hypothetical protein [Paraburkholderia sp. J8-2]|uniref:hypothetical protein n=1 Tax=Paraburkholderia sp. J8-2 TaxID=2805440 RepID=UPI002AB79CD1|nr:hypothetical protein [Paraburkholderia sp. J8-2]
MVRLTAIIISSVLALIGATFLLVQLNLISASRIGLLPPVIALTIALEVGVWAIRRRRQ